MHTKLTEIEKAAKALEKKLARQASAKAVREAAYAARQAAYIQAQQKLRDDFKASLSPEDAADLELALGECSVKIHPDGHQEVTNDFLHSVQEQYRTRGYLSAKQVTLLVSGIRRKRELAEKAASWKVIEVADVIKVMGKVTMVETVQGSYGPTTRIKFVSNYGRRFSFKTNRQDWIDDARACSEADKWVMFVGKVTWIAPDAGGPVVLTSRGASFGHLVK